MSWLALFCLMIAIGQVGVVVWVGRRMEEIREWATRWGALADTQRKHETDLRYLRGLINPMARSGRAPLPKHLRQENL